MKDFIPPAMQVHCIGSASTRLDAKAGKNQAQGGGGREGSNTWRIMKDFTPHFCECCSEESRRASIYFWGTPTGKLLRGALTGSGILQAPPFPLHYDPIPQGRTCLERILVRAFPLENRGFRLASSWTKMASNLSCTV